jgi:transposase
MKQLSPKTIKGMLTLFATTSLSQSSVSRVFKVAKSTVNAYLSLYKSSDLSFADISTMSDKEIAAALRHNRGAREPQRASLLRDLFPVLHQQLELRRLTLKSYWTNYKSDYPSGYQYSQFVILYHKWRREHGLPKVRHNTWKVPKISPEDLATLRKWRLSVERRKWERAVALLELQKGTSVSVVCKKIERSRRTIRKWRGTYMSKGIADLDLHRTKKPVQAVLDRITLKKHRLIQLLHESPSLHNINRSSWSLDTLAQVYNTLYAERICRSSVSEYIRAEGYTFKKARTVLTSPDPEYRAKLRKITDILSNLSPKQKFFSIDEFGPVAIKIRGGSALAHKDQLRTIPQRQKSKGSLICTAALELSSNQVTHFYSKNKNTTEMIKLLEVLIAVYKNEERIYFSWDAASWHASKQLYKKVDEVNSSDFKDKYATPLVELVPLPSGAQFLNVIESVFSGMAKAIIHNSDYQSVDECKAAIDRYFAERNEAFRRNPKRAGKRIWGNEVVEPVFKESNNCKDPKWR